MGESERRREAAAGEGAAVQAAATLVEEAPDAVIGIDRSGRIVLVNAQAAALFGYGRGELLQMAVEDLIPARLAGRHAALRGAYHEAPRPRAMGAGLDLFGRRKDGSEFPVDVSLTSIETPSGRMSAAFVRDVTARKSAEDNLRQANQDLESFSHTISHDIRAPLRAIRGFSAALMEDTGVGADPKAADYLRRIDRAGAVLERLVDDLLEYSRIGRLEVETRPVDVGAVVADVLRAVAPQIEEAHGAVTVDEDLPTAWGEPQLLHQAIANFITNAVKYVEPGAAPRVHVTSRRTQYGVKVIVEDNGIGIAPEHLARIWQPFERLHSRSQYAGTGVGLAIVARAAQRMGGRVGVESEPGKGSRFWVELRSAGGSST
jgi:PAS domain S-box-containing protein